MQISEPHHVQQNTFALFALGFRPFFLFAGLSAFILMFIWLLMFAYGKAVTETISPVYWHSHEMIFGYSTAVIAGFLLTAVRNWTSVTTLNGRSLAALFIVWLLPRLMYFFNLELIWLAAVDLAFLPLLALAVACPVIRARQWNNLFFSGLLLLYALAHLVFYAQFLFGIDKGEEWGIHSALGVILIIITVMAGRVVGFFIERGLNVKVRNDPWANHLALWGTAAYFVLQFVLSDILLAIILLLALFGHAWRLVGWYQRGVWSKPLLWVLYLGYGWLVIGFALTLLSHFQLAPESIAIHAFTAGAIGVITLGMMARVALGHTGRQMQSHLLVNIAFVLINMAALLRVFMPLLMPEFSLIWTQLAALSWIAAFVLFSLIYLPMLIRSRIDGAPG